MSEKELNLTEENQNLENNEQETPKISKFEQIQNLGAKANTALYTTKAITKTARAAALGYTQTGGLKGAIFGGAKNSISKERYKQAKPTLDVLRKADQTVGKAVKIAEKGGKALAVVGALGNLKDGKVVDAVTDFAKQQIQAKLTEMVTTQLANIASTAVGAISGVLAPILAPIAAFVGIVVLIIILAVGVVAGIYCIPIEPLRNTFETALGAIDTGSSLVSGDIGGTASKGTAIISGSYKSELRKIFESIGCKDPSDATECGTALSAVCLSSLLIKNPNDTIGMFRAQDLSKTTPVKISKLQDIIKAGQEAKVRQEVIEFVISLVATETTGNPWIEDNGARLGNCIGVIQFCPTSGGGWTLQNTLNYARTGKLIYFNNTTGPNYQYNPTEIKSNRVLQMKMAEGQYLIKVKEGGCKLAGYKLTYNIVAANLGCGGADSSGTKTINYAEAAKRNIEQVLACKEGDLQDGLGEGVDSKSLQEIVKATGVQSISVREIDGTKLFHVNGDTSPASPASSRKPAIAMAIIKSGVSLSKQIKITSDIVYNLSIPDEDDARFPIKKDSSYSIQFLLDAMLSVSSNGAANALVKELGGPASATQKINSAGYTQTKIGGYFSNTIVSSPSQITANDFSKALKDAWNNNNLKSYLSTSKDKFGLPSLGNKNARNSSVVGNGGVFKINNKLYVISVYYNGNGVDKGNGTSLNDSKIINATKQAIRLIENNKLETKTTNVPVSEDFWKFGEISASAAAPIEPAKTNAPISVSEMRQKLNQLYSKKIITQTSNIQKSDSIGYQSAFSDNMIIYMYSLYENGVVWVGGPLNYGRDGSHSGGSAYDFWGLGYRQEVESSGGIKGFGGPIAMWSQGSRQYAYPATNPKGNPADPNVYRIADLSEANLDSGVKAKILDLYSKAAKVANLTGALRSIVTHDASLPTIKSNISGQLLAGHTIKLKKDQTLSIDGSNGHHNHLHLSLLGSAKLVSAGSVVANVVSNCGEQTKETPKVNFRQKRESNV